jgi:hypothetical protein
VELDPTAVPVGPAFQSVYAGAPDISLHVDDRVHPNPKGTLLAAVVFYVVIFGDLPEIIEVGDESIRLDEKEKALFRNGVLIALGESSNRKQAR